MKRATVGWAHLAASYARAPPLQLSGAPEGVAPFVMRGMHTPALHASASLTVCHPRLRTGVARTVSGASMYGARGRPLARPTALEEDDKAALAEATFPRPLRRAEISARAAPALARPSLELAPPNLHERLGTCRKASPAP